MFVRTFLGGGARSMRRIKFTDTHIENGHFLCVYARAGEEITILRSIYLHTQIGNLRIRNLRMRRKKLCKPSYAYMLVPVLEKSQFRKYFGKWHQLYYGLIFNCRLI